MFKESPVIPKAILSGHKIKCKLGDTVRENKKAETNNVSLFETNKAPLDFL